MVLERAGLALGDGAVALRTVSGDITSNGTVAEDDFVKAEVKAGGDLPIAAAAGDHDSTVTAKQMVALGMVVPDLVHDAHDSDLGTSDTWIRTQVEQIQAGPDWQSGHLALVVVADEDDGSSGNKVLAVVASRYQDQRVVTAPLDHNSQTRLYDAVLGAPDLGRAATAASMRDAFGIVTTNP